MADFLAARTAGGIFDKEIESALQSIETVSDVLLTWGNELVDDLKTSERKENSSGTSLELNQSIKALPLQFDDDTITLAIAMLDYWDFTNSGVEGIGGTRADGTIYEKKPTLKKYFFKTSPIKRTPKLRDWANSKGLSEYALSYSIAHRGIEGTEWFDNVVTPQRLKDLSKKVAQAGAQEVSIALKTIFESSQDS